MKTLLTTCMLFSSLSVSAYVSGAGKVTATSGFYPSAQDSKGVNLVIKGKAAKVLFEEIKYTDVQTSSNSGLEIRQTETVKCIKEKKDIQCRILLNSDGSAAELPREVLNF